MNIKTLVKCDKCKVEQTYDKLLSKQDIEDLGYVEDERGFFCSVCNEAIQSFESETWLDISGYEGRYKISNTGKVWSVKNNMYIKIRTSWKGYNRVWIGSKGKQRVFALHRLVAQAFIPNPENKPQVNHLDGNKQNNRVDNLQWATVKENIEHAVKSGLTKPKNSGYCFKNLRRVAVYNYNKAEKIGEFDCIGDACKELNISKKYASRVLNGEGKSYKGYSFEKLDKVKKLRAINE